jgi:transposase
MWTPENRPKYNRDKLRYPSDLTDDEWSHIERLIPPAKRGGRKRSVDPREIVNGVMYVLSTGCQMRGSNSAFHFLRSSTTSDALSLRRREKILAQTSLASE